MSNPRSIPRNKESMVFVTVGTTRFDSLIAAVDSMEFANALRQCGYDTLIIQAGASLSNHKQPTLPNKEILDNGLRVEWLEYAPSLVSYLDNASLVISHAGAGSIFETLGRGIPLIAVPNASLMDDHQRELADKLGKEGHLFVATPDTLVDVVMEIKVDGLVRYEPGNGMGIVERIDAVSGARELRERGKKEG